MRGEGWWRSGKRERGCLWADDVYCVNNRSVLLVVFCACEHKCFVELKEDEMLNC